MWKTGNTEAFPLHPQIVTGLKDNYDLIFVTVNRFQLPAIIPELKDKKGDVLLIFMQNHWVIESELQPFFAPAEYLLAFPSHVSGEEAPIRRLRLLSFLKTPCCVKAAAR